MTKTPISTKQFRHFKLNWKTHRYNYKIVNKHFSIAQKNPTVETAKNHKFQYESIEI